MAYTQNAINQRELGNLFAYSPQTPANQGGSQFAYSPQTPANQGDFGNPFAYNQKNPYLSQMADTIRSQVTDNLQRNILPGIGSGAQLVGGYGGSRQGVVEANALKDANTALSNSLTSMYYGDYNDAMNRQLQKYGMDRSYSLGMANNATTARGQDMNYGLGMAQNSTSQRGQDMNYSLGMANNATTARGQDLNYGLGMSGLQNQYNIAGMQNQTAQRGQDLNYGANIYNTNAGVYNNAANNATTLNGQNLNYQVGMANANNSANSNLMNFYTNNRQLDQSGARLGMDMVNSANTGYLNQGQGIYNLGLTAQNNAWSPYTGFNSASSPYTGFGTTTNSNNGNAGAGFLGGAIAGGQLYNLFNQPAKQGA